MDRSKTHGKQDGSNEREILVGCVPPDEVSLLDAEGGYSSLGYSLYGRREANAWAGMLRRAVVIAPGCHVAVRVCRERLVTWYTVALVFGDYTVDPDNRDAGLYWATWLSDHLPSVWDEQAQAELGTNYFALVEKMKASLGDKDAAGWAKASRLVVSARMAALEAAVEAQELEFFSTLDPCVLVDLATLAEKTRAADKAAQEALVVASKTLEEQGKV